MHVLRGRQGEECEETHAQCHQVNLHYPSPLPPGFVEPGATYRGDAEKPGEPPALFRSTSLKVPHDAADYEVKQVSLLLW